MIREQGEKLSTGSFATDTSFIITEWDEQLAEMTGVPASGVLGRPLTDVVRNLPGRSLLARFENVRDLGTTEVLSATLHGYLIDCPPRCESRHFDRMQQRVTISAVRSLDEMIGVRVIIEDVTDRLERDKELARLLSDPNERVRLDTAEDLSSTSELLSAESAHAVIRALGDKSWRVRRKLVEGLTRRLGPEAVPVLLAAMRDGHLDFGLLNSALQVLKATSLNVTTSLIAFLSDDDIDLRVQSALALGEHHDPSAIPALIRALNDPNANVRSHAIEALGKLKAGEAVEPLISIAETRDFFLAFPSLLALKRIGDPSVANRIVPFLTEPDLSEGAVDTLAGIGGPECIEPIAGLLNNHEVAPSVVADALVEFAARFDAEDERIKELVRSSISSGGISAIDTALASLPPSSLHGLIKVSGWIDDPVLSSRLAGLMDIEELRDAAAAALLDQGESGIEHLARMIASGDPGSARSAAHFLGEADSPAAVDALIAALAADPEIAREAVKGLGRSTDARALDALLDELDQGDPALFPVVAETLRSTAVPGISPRMRELLNDDRAMVRSAVVRLAGNCEGDDCRDAVLAACSDTDETVRAAALEQFVSIPGSTALTQVTEMLRDGSAQVRAAAARVLGERGDIGAGPSLRDALKDPDPWTRYFAVRSLSLLNDRESYDLIRDMAELDGAEQVRVAAAEALAGK